uniref:NADH-ubiquinone oxidoreductase chain 6 n=1 Tax=Alleculinae sp. ENSP01 TaxID=1205808 RepID=A0A0S2MPP3_9CUCU|nr:NADH deshydrogenase subunit 6 [Alleculinae sp. ENSP01]
MSNLLLSVCLFLTIMMMLTKHPISMGTTLLIQTISISVLSGNFSQSLWFSYILFLIMVGGMMILFMYMTSIASNEKFKPNLKIMMTMPLVFTATLLMTENFKMIKTSETWKMNEQPMFQMSINKFINFPLTITFIMMMIYLFMAMMASVKISSFKEGSIRQMN